MLNLLSPPKSNNENALCSTPDDKLIALDQLELRRCGVVCKIDQQTPVTAQLIAMGVCLGRKVELIKRGDPLILRVMGTRIGLSARLAQQVWVQTCSVSRCESLPSPDITQGP